jgi:tetratricopeptide (TPR) repeat protein
VFLKAKYCPAVLILLGFLPVSFTHAQALQEKLSRLKNYSADDTAKVRLINDIAWDYSYLDYDSSKAFARQGATLARKLKFEDGAAEAYNIAGNCSRALLQFDSAFYFFGQSMVIRKKQNNKPKIAGVLQNIANVYNVQRKYAEAIVKYKEALKYAEESNYTQAQLVILANMVGVYQLVGENQRALDCGMRALEINKTFKDTVQDAYTYSNIALILQRQNQKMKAIEYNKKALAIAEKIRDASLLATINLNLGTEYKTVDLAESERYLSRASRQFIQLGDTVGLGMCYQNLGEGYRVLGKVKEAHEYLNKALTVFEHAGDKELISTTLFSISDILNQEGKKKEALLMANRAMAYAKEYADPVKVKNGYNTLSEIYSSMGDYKNAYYYLNRSFELGDTVFNKEIADKNGFLQAELNITAKENEIALKEKELKLSQTELSKQATLRNFLIGIVLFVLVFLYFVHAAYKNKKKDNAIILNQKHEVEMKNEIIEMQKKKVDLAYEELHEKNKEVMDSIRYAKRIQRALLTPEQYIDRNLNQLRKK